MSEKTMREVVQHLRAQKSQSIEELLAMSEALHEILRAQLNVSYRAREVDLRLLGLKPPREADEAQTINEIRAQAREVSEAADHVFAALREVQAAVVDWRIAGPTLIPAESRESREPPEPRDLSEPPTQTE